MSVERTIMDTRHSRDKRGDSIMKREGTGKTGRASEDYRPNGHGLKGAVTLSDMVGTVAPGAAPLIVVVGEVILPTMCVVLAGLIREARKEIRGIALPRMELVPSLYGCLHTLSEPLRLPRLVLGRDVLRGQPRFASPIEFGSQL